MYREIVGSLSILTFTSSVMQEARKQVSTSEFPRLDSPNDFLAAPYLSSAPVGSLPPLTSIIPFVDFLRELIHEN